MRVHMVLWLLFCINMCLKSISVLHQNCSKNIPLSNRTGNKYNAHKRTYPKQHLNPKVHIFHYVFAKKSYLIRAIQSKLVMGINYIYNSILLYFQFFNLFVQICEIGGHTFSISHKNEDPPITPSAKKQQNEISLPHKMGIMLFGNH